MRRTALRTALLVMVTAALAGIGIAVSRSMNAHRPHGRLDLGTDFLPEVAQRIRNFRRVKVTNGRVMWEITAQDAKYFEGQDQIIVREPRVTLYLGDGTRQMRIAGNTGRLGLEGHELTAATLEGEVVVEIDDLRVTTSRATYERDSDRITAPGAVAIHSRTLDVQGVGLEIAISPQQLRLLAGVRTVVRGNAAPS